MPRQNRPDPATLCHLANCPHAGGFDLGWQYYKRTISTNGRRVSLLNNTSPLILLKNNYKKRIKKGGHHSPLVTLHPHAIRYDYLFSFAQGNFNIQREANPFLPCIRIVSSSLGLCQVMPRRSICDSWMQQRPFLLCVAQQYIEYCYP